MKKQQKLVDPRYYLMFLYRIGMAVLLLSLTRMLLYVFNVTLFPGISLIDFLAIWFKGLRYDISAAIVLNSVFIFFSFFPFYLRSHPAYIRVMNLVFIIANSFGIAINLIDVIYYRFTLKRMTADIFDFLSQNSNEMMSLAGDFLLGYWFMSLVWIAFILFLVYFAVRTGKIGFSFKKWSAYRYITESLVFIMVLFLSSLGVRGGVQLKPLAIIDAGKRVQAHYIPLVLNSPFTIYRTFGQQGVPYKQYFDEQKLESIYSPVHMPEPGRDLKPNGLNLVIIILESFSKEHIGSLNPALDNGNYKGYTPFLDSLIGKSLVFDAYANGKKSMDAVPAILAGIPALMDKPYINSAYSGNTLEGLAHILGEYGYYTAFYHGGNNGTMGFESFARLAGYNDYYGRDEYHNDLDFDGKWGIFDEPYLQYCVKSLDDKKEPFHAVIFTLSSHHPYAVPAKYKEHFKKGNLDIHASISYADYALSRFFSEASKRSWFSNTLFILTADHTAEAYYPFYRNSVGQYAIPLIFYRQGGNLSGTATLTAQQADIMPSALHLLGISKTYICFGNDLFDPRTEGFAVNYANNLYQLIKNGKLIQFDGNDIAGFYNFANDSLLTRNLINDPSASPGKDVDFLKAFIQQYFERLGNNRLIIRK